jgi:ferredoxin
LKKIGFPVFASILLAAHFSRVQNDWLAMACLLSPFLLLVKRRWILMVYQTYLIIGGIVWIARIVDLAQMRQNEGRPWLRLAIILSVVTVYTILSALVLSSKKIQKRYSLEGAEDGERRYWPSYASFLLTLVLLSVVHLKVLPPVLLLERFLPGTGPVEIGLLAIYAAWITEIMLDAKRSSKTRTLIWSLFSGVFFAQFILGLSGFEKFMMTGKLHLPIPAMIIAGPVFRGSGFLMLILFLSTAIVIGAAWCSHLCYIGAWDNLLSRRIRRPKDLPRWSSPARIGILLSVVLAALVFRTAGMAPATATIIAVLYGIAGVALMILISRKNGVMTHCTVYCPIGLLANLIGKLNPFRIRFTEACDDCGACQSSCRYNALNENHVRQRKPGLSCTLCGDCVGSCPRGALRYKLFGFSAQTARTVFIVMAISLHALFIGVARL